MSLNIRILSFNFSFLTLKILLSSKEAIPNTGIRARLADTRYMLTVWPIGTIRLLLFLEKMASTGQATHTFIMKTGSEDKQVMHGMIMVTYKRIQYTPSIRVSPLLHLFFKTRKQ
jgi:hypothetical protein